MLETHDTAGMERVVRAHLDASADTLVRLWDAHPTSGQDE
jgi:hypothetical protein